MRHKVTKSIEFCYGHRLLDYSGNCRHLHGHNGRVEVDVESEELDDRGMVVDFGDVRDVVKGWIDANLDHRMLLRRDDPAIDAFTALGEPLFLLDHNPTAENIAKVIFGQARQSGINVSEVRLWETPSSYATYREPAC